MGLFPSGPSFLGNVAHGAYNWATRPDWELAITYTRAVFIHVRIGPLVVGYFLARREAEPVVGWWVVAKPVVAHPLIDRQRLVYLAEP